MHTYTYRVLCLGYTSFMVLTEYMHEYSGYWRKIATVECHHNHYVCNSFWTHYTVLFTTTLLFRTSNVLCLIASVLIHLELWLVCRLLPILCFYFPQCGSSYDKGTLAEDCICKCYCQLSVWGNVSKWLLGDKWCTSMDLWPFYSFSETNESLMRAA